MTAEEKVDILKAYVNYDENPFVKETLVFPYDFYRSIEHAIREIAKETRVYEKTLFLPVKSSSRLYNFDVSKLTKEKLDYVKTLELGMTSIIDGEQKTGILDREHSSDIESNRVIDSYALMRRFTLNGITFKSSLNTEGYPDGTFNEITSISGTTITPVDNVGSISGYYVINLSMSDKGVYSYVKVVSSATSTFVTETDMSNIWSATDKIYIVESLVPLIIIIGQFIPQMSYITSKSTVIPVLNQFIDDIDHFSIAYLFRLLGVRDPKQLQVYSGLVKSGVMKSTNQALTDIKKRVLPDKRVTVKSYVQEPTSIVYGR